VAIQHRGFIKTIDRYGYRSIAGVTAEPLLSSVELELALPIRPEARVLLSVELPVGLSVGRLYVLRDSPHHKSSDILSGDLYDVEEKKYLYLRTSLSHLIDVLPHIGGGNEP